MERIKEVDVGVWLYPPDYSDAQLKAIKEDIDFIMLPVQVLSNTPKYWDLFAGIKRGVSYGLIWRPPGQNLDHIAIKVCYEVITKFGNEIDFHYTDEPFSVCENYNVPDMPEILKGLREHIIKNSKSKNLIIGDGFRLFKYLPFSKVCWTYYATWFKIAFWWLRLPEWFGFFGGENIVELNNKYGIEWLWVHAEKKHQWKQLYSLSKDLNVPLMLYVPSERTTDEKILLINSFLIFVYSKQKVINKL